MMMKDMQMGGQQRNTVLCIIICWVVCLYVSAAPPTVRSRVTIFDAKKLLTASHLTASGFRKFLKNVDIVEVGHCLVLAMPLP